MNWIRLLSQVFFCVLVTNITGSIMFAIWLLFRRLLEKWNPKLVYYMLQWVVMMHLLPITYVALVANYNTGYILQDEGGLKMLFVFNLRHPVFNVLALAWLFITVRRCIQLFRSWFAKRRLSDYDFEDGNSLAQIEFERIKEVLEIKEDVELWRNDNPTLCSPFVKKKKVILPYLKYSKEELAVILYHELSHVKRHDGMFRGVAIFVMLINSWNYVTYKVWENVVLWSEASCDALALDGLEREGIDTKQYYETIGNLMDTDGTEREMFYFPMLLDKSESMTRRIEIMKNYRRGMSKAAKNATTALILVFAMVSSLAAGHVGVAAAELNDSALQVTQTIADDGEFNKTQGWSEEMDIPSSDAVNIVYVNDGIMTLGSATFDWSVPVGTRYVTSSIYLTKGTVVQIACTASPSNCTYWFGLMNADSSCTIVEGSGSGAHDFTVKSTGWYYVMVENRGTTVLNVSGSYRY